MLQEVERRLFKAVEAIQGMLSIQKSMLDRHERQIRDLHERVRFLAVARRAPKRNKDD